MTTLILISLFLITLVICSLVGLWIWNRYDIGDLKNVSNENNKFFARQMPPTNDIGRNGDVYFDKVSNIIYGPKANDVWSSGVFIGGDSDPRVEFGTVFPLATTGKDGDFFVKTDERQIYRNDGANWVDSWNSGELVPIAGPGFFSGETGDPPLNTIGIEGDKYFDTITRSLYIKESSGWSSAIPTVKSPFYRYTADSVSVTNPGDIFIESLVNTLIIHQEDLNGVDFQQILTDGYKFWNIKSVYGNFSKTFYVTGSVITTPFIRNLFFVNTTIDDVESVSPGDLLTITPDYSLKENICRIFDQNNGPFTADGSGNFDISTLVPTVNSLESNINDTAISGVGRLFSSDDYQIGGSEQFIGTWRQSLSLNFTASAAMTVEISLIKGPLATVFASRKYQITSPNVIYNFDLQDIIYEIATSGENINFRITTDIPLSTINNLNCKYTLERV